jgi:ABC-type transport system substrate-binding protein
VDVASWWFSVQITGCGNVRSSTQFAKEGNAMFENGPAGTGAYQFVSRTLKETAEYEAVPYDHWRVNPDFQTLKITAIPEDATRLAMILAGEADMVDIPKVLHEQAIDEGMVVWETPLATVGLTVVILGQYYATESNWNPDQDPWALPGRPGQLVREAMNRSIDRDQIINVLFKGRGEPMYNLTFHPTLEGWNPRWKSEFEDRYGFDQEKAKKLLDEAGFPGDANGQNRFSVEVYQSSLPGLPETIEVSQTISQAFQDIGIDAKLVTVEFAIALDAFREQHDAHFILPLRQTIRPATANMRIYWWGGIMNEETGIPRGGAVYAQEDDLYDVNYIKLLGEVDPDERERLTREVGDKIYDTYGAIPIVNIKSTLVVNPDVVEEYIFGSLTGVFGHLEYAKAVR